MKKNPLGLIVIIAALVGLFALNPDKEDFSTYLQRKTEKSIGGAFGRLAGGVASLAGNAYQRDNWLFMSLFYMDVNGKKTSKHLGIAKMFIDFSK
ncbi:MAG TPA: hypothetical protein PLC54_01695 [Spirochaetales bacterium]|nr:hypothetical protein [Spirochaetales bacterium]